MFEDLNKELMTIKERIWEKQKLENRRGQVREEIEKQSKKLFDVKYEMDKEKSDVEALEKMSFSTLVYTLIGSKGKKLKKETEEYIRAKIKYDEFNNLLQDLKAEESKLSTELMNIGFIERRFNEIRVIKEKMLMEAENDLKFELIDITEELIAVKDEQREYNEAISACRTVLFEMNKLIDYLNSASNWGTLDLLGGGIVTTAVKHSHIDDAKECAYRINKLMGQFKRELKDINTNYNIEVDLSSFESFGDYFFDGLFVDYLVQNKIEKALESTCRLRTQLQDVFNNMEIRKKNIDEKVQQLSYKRDGFIEGAR